MRLITGTMYRLAVCILSVPVAITAQSSQREPGAAPTGLVLYAEHAIKIGAHAQIEHGNVGVRTRVGLREGAQMTIGGHDKCRALYSPSIAFGHDASAKVVETNSLKRDPDSKIGSETAFPADMPALPLATATGSGPNIFVHEHEERTLTPGAYGELRVAHEAKVRLAPGRYVFASVKIGKKGKIYAGRAENSDGRKENGAVEVHIVGGLLMGEHAKIGFRDNDDHEAREFKIEVAGADPGITSEADGLGPRLAVTTGHGSKLHVLLSAPHGTVRLGNETRIRGAIAAYDILCGDKLHADFEDGFDLSASGNHGSQQLQGYFGAPPDAGVAQIAGPLAPGQQVTLSIGLPIPNRPALDSFIQQVSDPKQPNYKHYVTQAQFNSTYGASAGDYAAVTNWAQSNGLTVVRSFPNNLLLVVSGTASQVESALFTNLIYRLRADGSKFVSADRDPSLDLAVPLLHISGLTDYIKPKPSSVNGTPPTGTYWGWDFRNAYLGIGTPCAGLTGAGETIGLFQLDNFVQSDIDQYDTTAGAVSVQNTTPLPAIAPAVNGSASLGGGRVETTLDIEIAHSMAPGANIIVFEGSTGITDHGDSILHAMATSNPPITVGSSSWTYGWNPNGEQAMAQMAAEGISYFQASGDNGSIGDPTDNRDMQNQTLVGGTSLQTNALISGPPTPNYSSPYYNGDLTWTGSSGGFMNGGTQQCWPWPFCTSASTGIPGYQTGVGMATNGGSTTFRNFPDVSMDAFMTALVNGTPNSQVGTSEATPMWAGFMALANQQAVATGVGRIGFANPVIYAIGLTSTEPVPNLYTLTFNDVNDLGSTGTFSSVPGYDLTSGWGTPTCNLITQLASPAPLNPATFSEIQLHISTGDDGIRDDSIATVTVDFNGGIPSLVNTFHPQNASGWDPKGTVHDLLLALPQPMAPSSIKDVSFNLNSTSCCIGNSCCDNWTIYGLDVRLFLPPRGPEACVFHGEATQLGRLTHDNPTATFTPGGCAAAQGTPPPAMPMSEMTFIIGTGDDDLRSGSELDVAFRAPDNSLIEGGILKTSGSPLWDNNTQHTVTYTFITGPHPLSDFGSIELAINNSGNDEWHIYGMNVVGDTPGGPQTCIYDVQGQPIQVLNSGNRSMTIAPGAGCP